MELPKKASELRDQGFQPIPVHYKVPLEAGWNEDECPADFKQPRANGIGIVLGRRVHDGWLAALDVDCYNKDVSREFYIWLADRYGQIPYRIGVKPKFLVPFVCVNHQITRTTTEYYDGRSRIELLGLGQQFVAYGSPAQGVNYAWHNGELDLSRILRLNVEEVNEATRHWRVIAKEHGMQVTLEADDTDDTDDFLRDVNRGKLGLSKDEIAETLNQYPAQGLDYDRWLEVGMGLYHETDGEGYETWRTWSEQSDKHDERMMKRKWQSFDRDDGSVITFRSILKRARTKSASADVPSVTPAKTDDNQWLLHKYNRNNQSREPVHWLIKGVIESHHTAFMFGPSGSGKSHVALDMAMSIVTASDFHDHPVRGAGPVVFFCGEGYRGFQRRVDAYHQYHELESDGLYLYDNVILVGDGAKSDITRRLVSEMMTIKPAMIVIDTFARATAGMDENSAQDMGAAVAFLEKIKRKLNCALLIIHHTGVGDKSRMRGSSTLKAAADVEMSVIKSGRQVLLTNTKNKDEVEFQPIQLAIQPVNLQDLKTSEPLVDADGDQVTAAIVIENDDLAGKGPPPADTSSQLLWTVLQDLKALGQEIVIMDPVLVQTMGLDAPGEGFQKELVRDEFNARDPADNPATKRKHLSRAIDKLSESGHIAYRDEVIYVLP
jgi:hypothetical protein